MNTTSEKIIASDCLFKIEDFWYMMDKAALKEIVRQEKRFAAAGASVA